MDPNCFSPLTFVVRSNTVFTSRCRDVDVVDASVFFHLSSERLVFELNISSLTLVQLILECEGYFQSWRDVETVSSCQSALPKQEMSAELEFDYISYSDSLINHRHSQIHESRKWHFESAPQGSRPCPLDYFIFLRQTVSKEKHQVCDAATSLPLP